MTRLRLGVALLLPPPVDSEVDGLRRALGDGALGRIPPHLTLVPPVNVRSGDLGTALATLRGAAAGAPAEGLTLTLGPVQTFAPASPVLYLGVDGDLEALAALRERVFRGPLLRTLTFPFVPHVTLADEAPADRLQAGLEALASYDRSVTFDRLHLLQEGPGRRWEPVADVAFGPPAIVGRGGLAVELVSSDMLDPEVTALLAESGLAESGLAATGISPPAPDGPRLVVTARREGAVAGAGMAWLGPDGGRIEVFVGLEYRGQGVGTHVLAAVEAAVRGQGWQCSRLISLGGPAAFYAARSAYSKAIEL